MPGSIWRAFYQINCCASSDQLLTQACDLKADYQPNREDAMSSPSPMSFLLALFIGPSSDWVPINEILNQFDSQTDSQSQAERGSMMPNIEVDGTTLSIVLDGVEKFDGAWSMGPLPRLVAQLEPLATRLTAGKTGIFRSAVEDTADVLFLVFEPSGTSVDVRAVNTDTLPYTSMYPDQPDEIEPLASWIPVNGEPVDLGSSSDAPLRFNLEQMRGSLLTAAAQGRAVCERMGWKDTDRYNDKPLRG